MDGQPQASRCGSVSVCYVRTFADPLSLHGEAYSSLTTAN